MLDKKIIGCITKIIPCPFLGISYQYTKFCTIADIIQYPLSSQARPEVYDIHNNFKFDVVARYLLL